MSDSLQHFGLQNSSRDFKQKLPFPPPINFPNPSTEPESPVSPALQVNLWPAEPSGKPMEAVKGSMVTRISKEGGMNYQSTDDF